MVYTAGKICLLEINRTTSYPIAIDYHY